LPTFALLALAAALAILATTDSDAPDALLSVERAKRRSLLAPLSLGGKEAGGEGALGSEGEVSFPVPPSVMR
jgi:hypothetical protein